MHFLGHLLLGVLFITTICFTVVYGIDGLEQILEETKQIVLQQELSIQDRYTLVQYIQKGPAEAIFGTQLPGIVGNFPQNFDTFPFKQLIDGIKDNPVKLLIQELISDAEELGK